MNGLGRPWSVRLLDVSVELRISADFPTNSVVDTALKKLVAAGSSSGLFFDFDGVLSRIQDDPESVRPSPGVARVLETLVGQVGRVALVSSRNAEFLHSRLGAVPGLDIHGLYGLEYVEPDGTVAIRDEAREWTAAARDLCERATSELSDVYVEDKTLSIGLHYRLTPHARQAVEEWARAAAERTGFQVQPGRMAVELKPPLDVDKGTTLARLTDGLDAAWFFGDDLGDLPAFATLHERATVDPTFSCLAVGVGNDTVVDEVLAACDVFLASPALLVEFLRYVSGRLAASA